MTLPEVRLKYFTLYPPEPYSKDSLTPEADDAETKDRQEDLELYEETSVEQNDNIMFENSNTAGAKAPKTDSVSFYEHYRFIQTPADIRVINSLPPRPKLSQEEEIELRKKRWMLMKEWVASDDKNIKQWAMNQLYNESIGYIIYLIKRKTYSNGYDYLVENDRIGDLISGCFERILRYLDRYDGNYAVTTYYEKILTQYINEYRFADVYQSGHKNYATVVKVKKALAYFESIGISNASISEIATRAGLNISNTRTALDVINLSLALRIDDRSNSKDSFDIPDITANPLNYVMDKERSDTLSSALNILTDQELEILRYHYMFDEEDNKRGTRSIAQTASNFGLQVNTVKHVIAKARQKLYSNNALHELFGKKVRKVNVPLKTDERDSFFDDIIDVLLNEFGDLDEELNSTEHEMPYNKNIIW